MDFVSIQFTVLFEEPFWIGILERTQAKHYSACKITFGAEPKDYEVYAFLLKNQASLTFSPALNIEAAPKRRINPKRMQRQVQKQTQDSGIGTKAQQALKLQQEQGKLARKKRQKEQLEKEKEQKYAIKQEKRKEKHRGH